MIYNLLLVNLLRILKKIDFSFQRIIDKINRILVISKKIKQGNTGRNLYKTRFGDYFWLDENKYIDRLIIRDGLFEEYGTYAVKKIVKKDDIVLDIGANIGYYSVIFSKIVGTKGHVYAFEPLKEFQEILKLNLGANNLDNFQILDYGLSDGVKKMNIYKNESSATLHTLDENYEYQEKINLISLEDFVKESKIKKLDFIKIDVDGHEPAILKGGRNVIREYKPIILLELSHLHYLNYGITAWDFYSYLKEEGFFIYTEVNLEEIRSKQDFLIKCSNFNHTTNIIISYKPIIL